MAREINWDKEISEEDRTWLEQRPDMPAGNGMTVAQRLEEYDQKNGTAAKRSKQTRAERMDELRTIIADSQNELARLEVEQANEDNANVSETGDPSVGVVRDNTGVDGETPEGAPDPNAENPYADERVWTKAKLQDEIRKRNDERQSEGLEPLALTGNRSELVERLQKDDSEIES